MSDRKIRCLHVGELAKLPKKPHLVEGFLIAGALSVFYGPPKTRKSFLMLDLAMHVALGRAWCGRKVLPGPVVYVVGEGWHGVDKRVEAWCQHHKVERADVPLYVMEPVKLGGRAGKAIHDDADGILAAIREKAVEPVLIVLDTLNRTMVGDENSTAEMTRYVERVDFVRLSTRAHVAIVHHTGKDKEKGARGSSVSTGAVDTECPIDRSDDLTVVGPPIQRDLAEDFTKVFEPVEVEIGLAADCEPERSLVLRPTDRQPEAEEKLPKAARAALDALWAELRAGRGTSGGAGGPPIDSKLHGVREDRWRELCAAIPLTASDKPNTVNTAFRRVRDALLEAGKIGADDGWVWPWPKERADLFDADTPF